jgi:hypothetical protein
VGQSLRRAGAADSVAGALVRLEKERRTRRLTGASHQLELKLEDQMIAQRIIELIITPK